MTADCIIEIIKTRAAKSRRFFVKKAGVFALDKIARKVYNFNKIPKR